MIPKTKINELLPLGDTQLHDGILIRANIWQTLTQGARIPSVTQTAFTPCPSGVLPKGKRARTSRTAELTLKCQQWRSQIYSAKANI